MVSNEHDSEIKSGQKLSYYNKRLLLLLLLSSISNPYIMLQSVVLHYKPPQHCDISEIQDNLNNLNESHLNATIPWIEDSSGGIVRSSCSMFNIRNTTNRFFNESGKDDAVPCKKFYFEGVETSFTTEFQLVCENAWVQPLMVSIYFAGNLVVTLFGSYLSDRYGRKPIFLSFTFIQCVSCIIMSFSESLITYGAMMFLSGGANLINFTTAVILGCEILPQSHRYYVYFCLELGFSIGYLTVPASAYFLRDWRWFLRFSGMINILYIPYFWWLDESPKWLLATGKVQSANEVFAKIGKINKESDTDATKPEQIECKKEVEEISTVWKTMREMLKHPSLIWRLVIITSGWALVNVVYYAITLNTNSLTGDRFLNMLYGGIAELVGVLLYFFVVSKWGCRDCYCAIFCVGSVVLAVTPLFALWNPVVATISTMFCKLCVSICFNIIFVYTPQLFPTCIRNFATGISSAGGRIGSIISPIVMHAGGSGSSAVPSIVVAVAALGSTMAVLFRLPAIKTENLPQTVDEALAMKSVFSIPCFKRRDVTNAVITKAEQKDQENQRFLTAQI
ncbi:organic cation/carnitine transporter 2-like [Ciona intestinalis]